MSNCGFLWLLQQSLLDGSSSMRFTLSLLAALTSGSDVTWSHELYDVEFIDLNQTPLTSVACLRRVPRRTRHAFVHSFGPKVPKSQHEALIKMHGGSYTLMPASIQFASQVKPKSQGSCMFRTPTSHASLMLARGRIGCTGMSGEICLDAPAPLITNLAVPCIPMS